MKDYSKIHRIMQRLEVACGPWYKSDEVDYVITDIRRVSMEDYNELKELTGNELRTIVKEYLNTKPQN